MRMDHEGRPMRDRVMKPRKNSINLSIDAELAADAKAAGMNLSACLESALRAELKTVREAKWKEENREAIESMNAEIARNGLWCDKFRAW